MSIASISSASTAAQEAVETMAQAKAEALRGDQQAARKVAKSQVQAQDQDPKGATSDDNDGDTDHVLNVKA